LKLAAVVVTIVALGTADAATFQGSVAGGVQYTTTGTEDTTTQEALSVAISGFDWNTFTASDYTANIASHVVDFYHTTWNLFLTHYGNGSPDAVVKDYIDSALVSPDFKRPRTPKNPSHSTKRPDPEHTADSTNQFSSQAGTSITLEATTAQKNAAKAEMIEKTVLDMVTALAVIVNAEVGNLDKTAAYFYGASGKSAYTIYGRAEQRCANYGTCTGQGGEAAVNTAIGQALQVDDYGTVIKYIKVLYCQNVLRSANKIDQNMDDPIEIIGEGQAFWRFLRPWMKAYSVDAVKIFDRMFSTTYHPQAANNYNYCIAKKYFDAFLTTTMGTANAAATALGSLDEVPSGVTCPTDGNGLITTSSGVFTMIVTDAGTYTLKSVDNDMGASLQLSEAVKKVVDVLVAGTDTDIQVFASGMYEYTSLKGIADAADGDTADAFETHHGSDWISAIITDATSASSVYSTAVAKAKAIEATVMHTIATQSIISDLEHATQSEHSHTDAQKNAYWDSAAAKYFGTTDARSYTIYGSANKRGANYGQLTGAYSATNKAIIDAFNGAVSTANANTIIQNLKVIYTQSTLRYVFKFNEDLANGDDWTGNRAEAFAFYNNIAPYVKAADSAGHDAIAAFLDPTVSHSSCNNYHYCKAKSVLKAYDTAVWALVGTFESDDEVTCPATLPASGVIACSGSSATPAPSLSPAGNVTSPPPPPMPLILDDDDAGERPGVAGVFIALTIMALVNV
jgi:hypothetical protein